jgi:6-phosphogluconolactonase
MLPFAAGLWSCASGSVPSTPDESDETSSGGSGTTKTTSSPSSTSSSSRSGSSSSQSRTTGASESDEGTESTGTLSDSSTDATVEPTTEDNTSTSTEPDASTSDVATSTDDDSGTGSNSSSDDTTSDVPHTTYAFVVSVGGIVRALRLDPGAAPVQVADHELDVTFGDFFITANQTGSRLFVSYEDTVLALAFDAQAQSITELDTAVTAGGGTYVEVSPDGEHVLIASYNEGKVTHVGFDGTTFGSPSEFSPGQNAHSARVHASGDWAYVPCLGSNHVAQYALGETLTANTEATVSVPGGPRHMTFHPNGEVAYVLTELTAQAYAFTINSDGTLGPEPLDLEDVVTDVAQPSGSDVEITPDGKHLYTFERRTEQLYHFDIAQDGSLTASLEPVDFGQEVRAFAISPAGDLLLGGGSAGILYTYAIDPTTGELTEVGDALTDLQSIQATVIRDVPDSL